MNKKDCKDEKRPSFKLFKEDENLINNNQNCFIYCDKDDCMYDDFFFKEKETNNRNFVDKHKSSIDLNLTEKNLHEFLNKDLIKALDNDFMEPDEKDEGSDSNSANAYFTGNSELTSNASSPETNVRLPKKVENLDMNLNADKDSNKNNSSENVDKIDNNENSDNNSNIINSINNGNINKLDIKDDINILNDPLFAPLYLPKKMNNKIEEIKQEQGENEFSEHKIIEKKKTKKNNNSLKNKFDDDVEPIIMLSMVNKEEKTKLPLEIRVGDWICLYCNNLNFSFRIKCNRCGLLRKSSNCLLKQKYNNRNKYQYMNCNNYNYNDGYNPNVNYDENYYNLQQNIN